MGNLDYIEHEFSRKVVERATAVLPQGTQGALFTVTGRVILMKIVGEVTTVIQTQANATKIIANPTVGADVDLCATDDISADAVGTLYTITKDFSDAMIAQTSGAIEIAATAIVEDPVIAAGTIDLDCVASNSGSVKWVIHYMPLEPGAVIVSA